MHSNSVEKTNSCLLLCNKRQSICFHTQWPPHNEVARCTKIWPSYLPSPGSSSLLWIIDYKWEQEFALQKGTYDAPWGQCSPLSKILREVCLKCPQRDFFFKCNSCFITRSCSLKNIGCSYNNVMFFVYGVEQLLRVSKQLIFA